MVGSGGLLRHLTGTSRPSERQHGRLQEAKTRVWEGRGGLPVSLEEILANHSISLGGGRNTSRIS